MDKPEDNQFIPGHEESVPECQIDSSFPVSSWVLLLMFKLILTKKLAENCSFFIVEGKTAISRKLLLFSSALNTQ